MLGSVAPIKTKRNRISAFVRYLEDLFSSTQMGSTLASSDCRQCSMWSEDRTGSLQALKRTDSLTTVLLQSRAVESALPNVHSLHWCLPSSPLTYEFPNIWVFLKHLINGFVYRSLDWSLKWFYSILLKHNKRLSNETFKSLQKLLLSFRINSFQSLTYYFRFVSTFILLLFYYSNSDFPLMTIKRYLLLD